ncbi:MAG: phage holin family protein [Lacisediminihabitans sp.]
MSESTQKKRSLFALIADLPGLLIELVKSELEQLKLEITTKLKHAGVGVGLVAGAAGVGVLALGVFVAAAILGLAEVLPGWLAALIVGAVLLLAAGLLAALGIAQLKSGMPPAPMETISSVKRDVNAIKGIGKRGTK